MPEEQYSDYTTAFFSEINTKLNDMEERQRLLKEKMILFGKSYIETKENLEKEVLQLKISTKEMTQDLTKIKNIIVKISEDMENKARKSDIELLSKQMKMFLDFVSGRKS